MSANLPRCSRCREVAVMSPCRRCATPAELAATKTITRRDGTTYLAPVYPRLPS